MRYANTIEILKRLLIATREKKIVWIEEHQGDNVWYETSVGVELNNKIRFRFLYLEPWPQIGQDRYLIDFYMPGLNAYFACGTEGFDLLYEIYIAALDQEWARQDARYAVEFLRRNGL